MPQERGDMLEHFLRDRRRTTGTRLAPSHRRTFGRTVAPSHLAPSHRRTSHHRTVGQCVMA
jgi:hypothetical protein